MIITCPNCSTRYTLPQDKIKPGGQRVRCAKCGNVWHQQPDDVAAPEPAAEPVFVPPSGADLPADAAMAPPPDDIPPAAAAPPPEPTEPAPAAAGFADFHQETRPVSGSKEELVRPRPGDDSDGSSGAGRKWAIVLVILVVFALGAAILFKDKLAELAGFGGPGVTETAAPEASTPPEPVPEEPAPMTLDFENVESSVEEIEGIRYLQLEGVIINKGDRQQTVPPMSFEMRDKDGNSLGQWVFEVETQTLEPFAKAPFKSRKDLPPVALYELVPGFAIPGQAEAAPTEAAPGENGLPAEVAPGAAAPAAGNAAPAQPTATTPAN